MNDLNELYVCEYSASQKVFHLAPLAEVLQMNADSIVRGCASDFIPIALVEDRIEADIVCNRILERMKKDRRRAELNDDDD